MKTEYRKIENGQLRCSVCGPRPVEEFWVNKKGNFDGMCDRCRKARQNARNNNLSLEHYLEIMQAAEGRCALCGRDGVSLQLNHCHKTGKLRGVLCVKCNKDVVLFERDTDFLNRVSEYVQRWAGLPMTAAEAAEGAERLRRHGRIRDTAKARPRKKASNPTNNEKRRMKITRIHATVRVRARKSSQPDPALAETQVIKLGGKAKAVELVLDAIKNGSPTTSQIRAYTGLGRPECAACLKKLIASGAVLSSKGKHLIVPAIGPIDPERRLSDADAARVFGLRGNHRKPGGGQ